MADKIEVEIDKLHTAAGITGEVRDHINTVLTTLQGKLVGYGDCWGADSLGHQFAGTGSGDGYLAAKKGMVSGAQNFSTAFDQFSTGQTDSANYLAKIEHDNSVTFEK